MKKFLLSLSAIALSATAFAGEVTFDFTTDSYGLPAYDENLGNNSPFVTVPSTITSGDVQIILNGENPEANCWRLWNDGLRAYSKGAPYFTVSTTNSENVTGVTFTAKSGCTFAVKGTDENVTSWEGDQKEISFQYTSATPEEKNSKNLAVFTITVTYGDTTLEVPETPEEPGDDEPTEVVNSIAEVANGVTLETNAVVTAQSTRGLILTDATGSIFYYNNNVDLTTYPIGTKVNVKAEVSSYGTGYQLSSSASLEVAGTETVTYPSPTEVTAAMAQEELENTVPHIATYVTAEGTLAISGNYYNITIPGLENGMGSLYTPTEDLKALLANGNTYKFTGYYTGVTNGKYLYMVLTNVELVSNGDNQEPEPGPEPDPEPTPSFTGKAVTFDFTDPTSLSATFDGEAIDFNDADATEYNLTGVTIFDEVISIYSIASEDASTMPRLFLSSSASAPGWTYRFYKDNTVTISAETGYKIEGIEFKATNLGNASVQFTGNGQFNNNVWTSSDNEAATEVVITKTESGNNPTISTMTVYYLVNETVGVNEITNVNAPIEYFNLQGQKVLNPSNGIFIIRQGDKTSKVVIR